MRYRYKHATYRAAARVSDLEADALWDRVWPQLLVGDSDLQEEIAEWDADPEEYLTEFYWEPFVDATADLNAMRGEPCYRALSFRTPVDPRQGDPLGIYWTQERDAAEPYWGDTEAHVYVYRATVDLAAVDLEATLLANLRIETEAEITFRSGSQIWIVECETGAGIVSVQDWRHT